MWINNRKILQRKEKKFYKQKRIQYTKKNKFIKEFPSQNFE